MNRTRRVSLTYAEVDSLIEAANQRERGEWDSDNDIPYAVLINARNKLIEASNWFAEEA